MADPSPKRTMRRCWVIGCGQYGKWIEEHDYVEGSHPRIHEDPVGTPPSVVADLTRMRPA